MLRCTQFSRIVVEAQKFPSPIAVWTRFYNKEYDHAQLRVSFPDVDELEHKERTRHRFKDHRTRLESEWKETRSQGVDPLLKRLKGESKMPKGSIEAPMLQNFSGLSGVPKEQIGNRQVRIFTPARNTMQSGSYATHKWRLQFDEQERWENPNIGWTSSADPLSCLNLEFTSVEDAVAYCRRMGYTYTIEPRHVSRVGPKNYAANYAWNSNTRIPSK